MPIQREAHLQRRSLGCTHARPCAPAADGRAHHLGPAMAALPPTRLDRCTAPHEAGRWYMHCMLPDCTRVSVSNLYDGHALHARDLVSVQQVPWRFCQCWSWWPKSGAVEKCVLGTSPNVLRPHHRHKIACSLCLGSIALEVRRGVHHPAASGIAHEVQSPLHAFAPASCTAGSLVVPQSGSCLQAESITSREQAGDQDLTKG